MEVRDLIAWLNLQDKDAKVKCWVQVGDEEISNPNMATVPKDEIFDWQDRLDDIDYDQKHLKQGMTELFHLIDDILDELESRLQLNPYLVEELEDLHKKIEEGDMSDFVKIDIPERSFWDYVNDFCEAIKIRDYVESSEFLILIVKNKFKNDPINVYIEGSSLYIKKTGNISLSTSIIAEMLKIDPSDIDDRQWEQGIFRIPLKPR